MKIKELRRELQAEWESITQDIRQLETRRMQIERTLALLGPAKPRTKPAPVK